MDALKRKAKATLEDIKHAENKEKDLARQVRLAKEIANQAESEVDNLKARIKVKKQDVENCWQKIKDKERDHRESEELAEKGEKERKLLEGKGFDLDDKLVMLDIKWKDAKKGADELEGKLAESKRRHSTLKSELSELLARLNAAESKICHLSEDADSETISLVNLEIKHKRYGKREEYYEDKIEMMQQQIRNLSIETFSNEEKAKSLATHREKLKKQANSWSKCLASIKRELEDVKADLNQ